MSENPWIQVAPGVFQRRYGTLDVSVVVIFDRVLDKGGRRGRIDPLNPLNPLNPEGL
ncbi:hypothetical protein GCM10022381_30930 [Leifsonia kafniensis]|uniref:Uncharacterized protein n=1 Tax=Leifsonia kafniensis TaxID=475957 RepID=A0ABP7KV93_9MICO